MKEDVKLDAISFTTSRTAADPDAQANSNTAADANSDTQFTAQLDILKVLQEPLKPNLKRRDLKISADGSWLYGETFYVERRGRKFWFTLFTHKSKFAPAGYVKKWTYWGMKLMEGDLASEKGCLEITKR